MAAWSCKVLLSVCLLGLVQAQMDPIDPDLDHHDDFERQANGIFGALSNVEDMQGDLRKAKETLASDSAEVIAENTRSIDRSNNALRTFQGVLHGSLTKHMAQKRALEKLKGMLVDVEHEIELQHGKITNLKEHHTQLILGSKEMTAHFKTKFERLNRGLERYQKILGYLQRQIVELRKKMAYMVDEGPKEIEKAKGEYAKASDAMLALHAKIGQVKVEMMRHRDYLSGSSATLKKSLALHKNMVTDHTSSLTSAHEQALHEQKQLAHANAQLSSATNTLARARRVIKSQSAALQDLHTADKKSEKKKKQIELLRKRVFLATEHNQKLSAALAKAQHNLASAHRSAWKVRHTTEQLHRNHTHRMNNATHYLDTVNSNIQRVNRALVEVTSTLNRAYKVLKAQKAKYNMEKQKRFEKIRRKQEMIRKLESKLQAWEGQNQQIASDIQSNNASLSKAKYTTNMELRRSKGLKDKLLRGVKYTKNLLKRDHDALNFAKQAVEEAHEGMRNLKNAALTQHRVNELLRNNEKGGLEETDDVLNVLGKVLGTDELPHKGVGVAIPAAPTGYDVQLGLDAPIDNKWNHDIDNVVEGDSMAFRSKHKKSDKSSPRSELDASVDELTRQIEEAQKDLS